MQHDTPLIRLDYNGLPIDWKSTGPSICTQILSNLEQMAADLPFLFPRPEHCNDAFRVQHELNEIEQKCARLNGDTPAKLEKKAHRLARAVSYLFVSRTLKLLLHSGTDFSDVIQGICNQHLPEDRPGHLLDVWQSEDPKFHAKICVSDEEALPLISSTNGRFWPGPCYRVTDLPRVAIINKVIPNILFRLGNHDDIVQQPELECILDLHTYTVGMA